MTLTIEVSPETQTGLIALAQAHGMSVEAYLLRIVECAVQPNPPMSPQQRAAAWVESAARFPDTHALSDQAITRESMYADSGT